MCGSTVGDADDSTIFRCGAVRDHGGVSRIIVAGARAEAFSIAEEKLLAPDPTETIVRPAAVAVVDRLVFVGDIEA